MSQAYRLNLFAILRVYRLKQYTKIMESLTGQLSLAAQGLPQAVPGPSSSSRLPWDKGWLWLLTHAQAWSPSCCLAALTQAKTVSPILLLQLPLFLLLPLLLSSSLVSWMSCPHTRHPTVPVLHPAVLVLRPPCCPLCPLCCPTDSQFVMDCLCALCVPLGTDLIPGLLGSVAVLDPLPVPTPGLSYHELTSTAGNLMT